MRVPLDHNSGFGSCSRTGGHSNPKRGRSPRSTRDHGPNANGYTHDGRLGPDLVIVDDLL